MSPQPGLLHHTMEKMDGMNAPQGLQSELTMKWRHTGRPTTTRYETTQSGQWLRAKQLLHTTASNFSLFNHKGKKRDLKHFKIHM